MLPPLLTILGIGGLVVGAVVFWNGIQNWLADLIARLERDMHLQADRLYSALVVLDRAVVTGQRMVVATVRAFYRADEGRYETVEEQRTLEPEQLPEEIRTRLERGAATYELSTGTLRSANAPTYKLVVRRVE